MSEFPRGAFRTIGEYAKLIEMNRNVSVYHSPRIEMADWKTELMGIKKLTPERIEHHTLIFVKSPGLTFDGVTMRIPWPSEHPMDFGYLFKNFWDAYAHACRVEQSKNE